MISRWKGLLAYLLLPVLLAGCMYPQSRLAQNQVAPKEAVRNVQAALDAYFAEKGILPIQTADQSVPIYEKYRLDFPKLQGSGQLSAIPAAAFEGGGSFYFLIQNELVTPEIKLMDIIVAQKVNDVQRSVQSHLQAGGKLPAVKEMYPEFFTIDYQVLRIKEPTLMSVFSGHTLQLMVSQNGEVLVDYGPDIMQFTQERAYKDDELAALEDLRALLASESIYVPVKSPIYQWNKGEPLAVISSQVE